MKKLMVIVFMALIGSAAVSAQQAYDQFEIQVDGLGCPFCAYGLEKKFKEFKGIKQVKIDIQTGIFTFAYPADKPLSLQAVEDQVKKAGYTPVAASIMRADGAMEARHADPKSVMDDANVTQGNFKVAGNCDMCKARIEKAALQHTGVYTASWNKDSKNLMVGYDKNTTSLEAVQKSIAQSGHDTEHHRAHSDAYNNLPGCCHYERIAPINK